MSAFLAAVQFLTVIPCPTTEERSPARSAMLFPVVGALLGGLAVGVHHVLAPHAPPGVVAAVILALWAIVTGGLHEDGLADTFDAFAGGRTRDDVRRIMKDSRIGTFGALALVFSVLIRWQALAALPEARIVPALLASQILPRAGMVLLAVLAGGAGSGLGAAFAAGLTRAQAAATVGLALALAAPFCGRQLLAFAVVCLTVVGAASVHFRRRLGGVTGDCLGAANQLQEMGVLVVAACL